MRFFFVISFYRCTQTVLVKVAFFVWPSNQLDSVELCVLRFLHVDDTIISYTLQKCSQLATESNVEKVVINSWIQPIFSGVHAL